MDDDQYPDLDELDEMQAEEALTGAMENVVDALNEREYTIAQCNELTRSILEAPDGWKVVHVSNTAIGEILNKRPRRSDS